VAVEAVIAENGNRHQHETITAYYDLIKQKSIRIDLKLELERLDDWN